jgi:hypothetical protein
MADVIKIGAIAVAIILAIVSVGLYTSHQNQLNELTSTYDAYVATHQYTDAEYLALQDQVRNLTDILTLQKHHVLLNHYDVNQPAGGYNSWAFTTINHTGYLRITIHSSTTATAYARVVYTYNGTTWALSKTLGTAGTADFPVLPSSSIEVGIGNTNTYDPAAHDVSIVYHY